MISAPTEQQVTPDVELTGMYKSLLAEIEDMCREEDWDGDGLDNGADLYPRDIDADRNGISDGYEGMTHITGDMPVRYGDVRLVISNSQSGIVSFRGDYYISSYAGWAAFDNVDGTPYVYVGGVWGKAEHEWIGETCYINVPGTCRIRFSDNGKPEDRDVVIDVVPAEFVNRPDERYSVANAPLDQLNEIYTSVDNGKTVQISILTEGGEQLLLVHGYDKDGNLIVANPKTFSNAGKINLDIQAQLFWNGANYSMRSWFEFEWGELSAQNDDVLTVFR